MNRYDVIVIGSGPAGYNTAIRAAQLGLRTACVERTSKVGGAGVNTGCFPSRILLHASEIYAAARNGEYAALGVEGVATLNLARMMGHKASVVDLMAGSIQSLLHQHRVTLHHGQARLAGPGRVGITGTDGSEFILIADHIVIATGSEPIPFPAADFDDNRILDSADALCLGRVPGHLAVVGGGATGIEIGSIWQRLGARVTVIERCDRICPWLDDEVATSLEHALRQQGMDIELSAEVIALEAHGDGVRLRLQAPGGGDERWLDAEAVLVAIGRRPALTGLALESVGLRADAQGKQPHGGPCMPVPGLWLVGDTTGGPMLARKAEEEGIACAEQIAGLPGFVDYSSMPNAIFTTPEVAMIGRTEGELRAAGTTYTVGRFPFEANPRARIHGHARGFVKLLVDDRTNLVAGAHLIGPGAAELVSEVAVAMDASTICEDLARMSFAHPTLSEALRQAAMAASGWMMHG